MNYKLFFNPFERYQERLLIGIGLITLILGSISAYFLKARFDGVLDLHFVPQLKLWHPLVDNFLNVFCLSVCLGTLGFYINKKTRIIDVLAVILIARIPYYTMSVFNIKDVMINISEKIVKDPMAVTTGIISTPELLLLLIFSGLSLLVIIWQLVLLYNGLKVVSHGKGTKFVILFIIAIIVAEIFSKLLINY